MLHSYKNFKIIALLALCIAPATGFAMDADDHNITHWNAKGFKSASSAAENCLRYVAQSACDHPYVTLTIGGTAVFVVGWRLLVATPKDVENAKARIKLHGVQETEKTNGKLLLLQAGTKEKFVDYKKKQAEVRAIRGEAQQNLEQAKVKLATFKIDFDALGVNQSVIFSALKGILDRAAVQSNQMNREADAMGAVVNAVPARHDGMRTSLAAIVTEIGGAQVDLAQLLAQLRQHGQDTTAIENQLRQLLSAQDQEILDRELEALNSTNVQEIVELSEEETRSE